MDSICFVINVLDFWLGGLLSLNWGQHRARSDSIVHPCLSWGCITAQIRDERRSDDLRMLGNYRNYPPLSTARHRPFVRLKVRQENYMGMGIAVWL
jgi:hypothetical protein